MSTPVADLQRERQRYDRRRAYEMATTRARLLLASIGWTANSEEIRSAAIDRYPRLGSDGRALRRTIRLAVSLQRHEAAATRHLPPETIMAARKRKERTVAKGKAEIPARQLTPQQRDRVAELCEEALRKDPAAVGSKVLEQIHAEGIALTGGSFYATYWTRARAKQKGRAEAAKDERMPLDGAGPAPGTELATTLTSNHVHVYAEDDVVGRVVVDIHGPLALVYRVASAVGTVMSREGA